MKKSQPYSNPYLAGIGLGLTLLASFVLVGRGLGASGAFVSAIASAADSIAPTAARSNEFLAGYIGDGQQSPLMSFLPFEVVGVFVGALISGLLAGRVRVMTEKGPRVSVRARLATAFAGGMLTAIGAELARGCTSGQALTGGSLLNLGSWAFMMMVFAGAYAVAYFMRWQWR